MRPNPAAWDNFFSLDKEDKRFFIHDDRCEIDRLQPDFISWLELFVGKMREATGCSVTGDGWHYEEISTTGILDLNLAFEEPRHAAMFKLIYGSHDVYQG